MVEDKKILTSIKKGKVSVVGFDGGRQLREKLINYGIRPGVEIEVISMARKGAAIIEVLGSRVVLGHGMAQKIYVE